LSPLNNLKPSGARTGSNNGNQMFSPPQSRQGSGTDGFPIFEQSGKNPDLAEEWTAFQTIERAQVQIQDHDPTVSEKVEAWERQRRDPSMSSVFDCPIAEPFSSHSKKTWNPQQSFPEQSFPLEKDEGSMKENAGHRENRRGYQNYVPKDNTGKRGIYTEKTTNRNAGMGFSSDSEEDSDVDDDSFDSVALWEKPGRTIGIQNFHKAKRVSSSGSLGSSSIRSYGSQPNHSEDFKSVGSFGNVSASGSYTKPLGLPSNAIMASMLFRTHYNIDQQDVENKIKAKEEEYSKDQKNRRGDIPDNVHADYDYMSNVSSFSEETTTFHDAWRKPSRDLLDYFSRARTMEVDTKKRLEAQRAKAKTLFEA